MMMTMMMMQRCEKSAKECLSTQVMLVRRSPLWNMVIMMIIWELVEEQKLVLELIIINFGANS